MSVSPEIVTLGSGRLELDVVPGVGGSIARFTLRDERGAVELLRRADGEALAARDPRGLGSFPLVPYCGRIRNATLRFRGETIRESARFSPEPHAIHGHGWQRAWNVDEGDARGVTLSYRHESGAWPFAYTARQRLELGDDTLSLSMSLRNESQRPMPAALGWHPYFPRTARATLTAKVTGMWRLDETKIPREHLAPPPGPDPTRGVSPDRDPLDNPFTGWDGTALVAWPEHGLALEMRASEGLDHLVVYTPPRADFFCVEPVSHCPGHFDDGLAPGEWLRAAVTLQLRRRA